MSKTHDIFILGKSPIKWRQCPNMTLAVDWDVFILGKSPIKWRQRLYMTLAVDWDVKHQEFKLRQGIFEISSGMNMPEKP